MSWKKVKIKKISSSRLKTVYDVVEPKHRLFVTNGILTEDTVSFGIPYGRGAPAIAEHFDREVGEVQGYIDEWWKQFPELKRWIKQQHHLIRKQGYIRTPYGRRRLLPGIYSDDPRIASNALNGSINSQVQGTAADVCSEALIKLNQWRRKNHAQFKIVMTIHDSIIFDVPKEEMHLVKDLFIPTMGNIKHPWMRNVPFTTTTKIAKNWGDMETMVMHSEGEKRPMGELLNGEEI